MSNELIVSIQPDYVQDGVEYYKTESINKAVDEALQGVKAHNTSDVEMVRELVSKWFAINNHEGIDISAAGDAAAKTWNDMCQTIDKATAWLAEREK